MKVKLALVFMLLALPAAAQDLKPSREYPLAARIVKVETRTGVSAVRPAAPVQTDSQGNVYGGGGGGGGESYEWHLMKAVIGDKLYGLSVQENGSAIVRAIQRRTWLEIGDYRAKRLKHGFEFEYQDDKGKLHHEKLEIESEEPAPADESTPTVTPLSESPKQK